MDLYPPTLAGPLAGKQIGILMESDFVEAEIAYYRLRFAEEGADVRLYTRLWGSPSQTYTGHELGGRITVDGDLEALDYCELRSLHALIVPAGMVAERLRYSERPTGVAPAVALLRKAFRLTGLVKAFSCHGLWLMSAVPELVRGRSVTCHNNLVADVRNMGAAYADADVVVDGDLVTTRTAQHCHLLARTVIGRLAERSAA